MPTEGLTFLFTDIEGSTSLWETYPEAMRSALATHDALMRRSIEAQRGRIFKTVGDAFYAVFDTAGDALTAALQAQRAIHHEKWRDIPGLRVRMALNTGQAEERDGDYFGQALNRVARLLAAAHGGQTLLSATTQTALGALPDDVQLRDLGERRLKDLLRPERIFQAVTADLPSDFPPLNTLEAVPNNLPTALTSFVGREREIAEAKRLLASTHLLTLTGSGGCGKTRLSLQVAADLLDTFAGGVWFVELAALTDPANVPSTLAIAMGIHEDPAKPILTSIAENVRNKTVLVILDNCEHLVGACAEVTTTLLRLCPNLRIMTSTREALGIAGETVWRVPSLPATEATRLFVDRAVAVAPAFESTEQNAAAIMEVCKRLDGIPLAIELAAARVNVLHVDQIAARLNDRFRLLTGGSRTALPRQRTLRAAIDWSYDLLSDAERTLLRRISVFSNGFTLDAAESVGSDQSGGPVPATDTLDLLSRLVEKSLVMVEKAEYEARYSLLDMVRQYSRDRLLEAGEAEPVARRHRDYYLGLAENAAPELHGPDQVKWLDRLAQDHDNFRAALAWCQSDPESTDHSLRLAAALYRFWFMRGYFEEGRMWLADAMTRAGGSKRTPDWAKALRAAGSLASMRGDYVSARSLLEESLSIFREVNDRGAVAATLINLAQAAQFQGNHTLAQSYSEEALAKFRDLGAAQGIARGLSTLATVLHYQGEDVQARELLKESLEIYRQLKLKEGIAYVLNLLGLLAASSGDYTAARALHEESLPIHRRSGHKVNLVAALLNIGHVAIWQNDTAGADLVLLEALNIARQIAEPRWTSLALHNLGLTALRRGDYEAARRYMTDALKIRADVGDKLSIAYSIEGIAALAVEERNLKLAARLLASAETLRKDIGARLEQAEQKQHHMLVESLRTNLALDVFEQEWERGKVLPVADVIGQSLA